MKKPGILLLIAIAGAICTTAARAGDNMPGGLVELFHKTHPQIEVGKLSSSPVEGLYEIEGSRSVFYWEPKSDILVIGQLIDNSGKNLTQAKQRALNVAFAERESKAMNANYAHFKGELAKAIRIGTGPNEVIEISDPDCPFCRKMNGFWNKRKDVTRYVFFLPLKQLHRDAVSHASYIISANDQVAALAEVETGRLDGKLSPVVPEGSTDKVREHLAVASGMGINGTPAYYVNGHFVNGANVALIERQLKNGGAK